MEAGAGGALGLHPRRLADWYGSTVVMTPQTPETTSAFKRHAEAFTRGFARGFVVWFLRALLPVSFLIALVLFPSALRYPGDCARAFRQMWRDPL